MARHEDIRLSVTFLDCLKTRRWVRRWKDQASPLWLIRLWFWARVHSPDGYVDLEPEDVAEVCGAPPHVEPAELWAALLGGWIDAEEGRYRLHNWSIRQPFSDASNQREDNSRRGWAVGQLKRSEAWDDGMSDLSTTNLVRLARKAMKTKSPTTLAKVPPHFGQSTPPLTPQVPGTTGCPAPAPAPAPAPIAGGRGHGGTQKKKTIPSGDACPLGGQHPASDTTGDQTPGKPERLPWYEPRPDPKVYTAEEIARAKANVAPIVEALKNQRRKAKVTPTDERREE